MRHPHILVEREPERCFLQDPSHPENDRSQNKAPASSAILHAPSPTIPTPTHTCLRNIITLAMCWWFDVWSNRQLAMARLEKISHLLIGTGGGADFTTLREGRWRRRLGFTFGTADDNEIP